jgi:hypothetical protein
MIEIKVTLPKVEYAKKKWLDAIASKQRAKSLPALRRLFNQTVFGWSTKPQMGYATTKRSDEISLFIFAKGAGSDTWNLLNAGSPKHPIPPRNKKYLVFRRGYKAATTPGSLQSGRKYRSGKIEFSKGIPMHPGFDPRRFTELIAEEYDKTYAAHVQEAISEVASRV